MTKFLTSEPDVDGVVVVTMANDGRPNVIDREFVKGLNEALSTAKAKKPHGVIITASDDSGFIAGANLHEILQVETAEDVESFCKEATDVFQAWNSVAVPVVAAINGPCLGGGLEFALWCHYRIAADIKQVSIGLPEVNLGLIPALGGASLVSRLLPFPKALDVVCGGKRYTAREALSLGLVDRVATPDRLQEEAKQVILTWAHSNPKRQVRRTALDSKIGRNVISIFAKKNIRKRTNGNYPAPEVAVDVMRRGLKGENLDDALCLEREGVGNLLAGEGAFAKRLIRLFMDQESHKKTYPNRPENLDPVACALPKKLGIVGAGLMGLGIAQLAAYKGIEVRILDVNTETIELVPARIKKLTAPLLKRKKITQRQYEEICARVVASTDPDNLEGCDFFIEAVIENMGIKHKVLAQIDNAATGGHEMPEVVATNTSSLSVADFAKKAALPSHVIGMHFFSPVHRMPLVEIAPYKNEESYKGGTSKETIERTFRLAVALGKVPIMCNDSTGFIVNRLLGAYLNEAAWACIEGYSPATIDKTMRDWGMPLGPCELMDEVGIFVSGEVAKKLQEAWPNNANFDVPVLIEHMIQRNCLGKRSKEQEGFYSYKSGKQKRSTQFKEIVSPLKEWYRRDTKPLTVDRFLKVMRTEAQALLDDGVVHSAGDIDLAMILGTGYPPFQKPLV